MIALEIKDMTCGHCASTITKAVQATDRNARVEIDLARHLVQIHPAAADARALIDAIKDAGYSPQRLADSAPA